VIQPLKRPPRSRNQQGSAWVGRKQKEKAGRDIEEQDAQDDQKNRKEKEEARGSNPLREGKRTMGDAGQPKEARLGDQLP